MTKKDKQPEMCKGCWCWEKFGSKCYYNFLDRPICYSKVISEEEFVNLENLRYKRL